jgi:Cu2+-exporting ATPase
MDEKLTHIRLLLDIAEQFEKKQKDNLIITVVPGVICVGGVFLLHFGIYASIVLYYGSLAAGLFNAIKPLSLQRSDRV